MNSDHWMLSKSLAQFNRSSQYTKDAQKSINESLLVTLNQTENNISWCRRVVHRFAPCRVDQPRQTYSKIFEAFKSEIDWQTVGRGARELLPDKISAPEQPAFGADQNWGFFLNFFPNAFFKVIQVQLGLTGRNLEGPQLTGSKFKGNLFE